MEATARARLGEAGAGAEQKAVPGLKSRGGHRGRGDVGTDPASSSVGDRKIAVMREETGAEMWGEEGLGYGLAVGRAFGARGRDRRAVSCQLSYL